MARRAWAPVILVLAAVLAGCRDGAPHAQSTVPVAATPSAVERAATAPASSSDVVTDGAEIVIAPGVSGTVEEALVRQAFRQAAAQGERDFGIRAERTVMIYIDPDNAIGLEDALGLSSKFAIHLRAGRARSLVSLLPLMMHEYTHVLQYQSGRLRPQWWIEGEADHESLRVRDPASAERERRALYGRLAGDVRSGKAPSLASLRGSVAWDDYIRKAGSSRAYGWGNAAVAFIEQRAGFEGVARIFNDSTSPNTLGRFDDLVRELTGLSPAEFDTALRQWVTEQARG